jgi:primosomal protein N' (replication factor Y)
MIAKGLHFPQVTLVGVLNSDASLNIPDFRASETVFQLITQVAGRSGRGHINGEVIIQTFLPENSTIRLASKQDYEEFFAEEIAVRNLFRFPPFTHLAKIIFSGKNGDKTVKVANEIRESLAKNLPSDFELHPVVPCGYAKIKDRYRFQFLVRGSPIHPLNRAVEIVRQNMSLPSDVKMLVDVNPVTTYF